MTKPSNFVINSDYATFKNDERGSITLTVPNGTVVGANSRVTLQSTLTIGKRDASVRSKMRCNGGTWRNCASMQKQYNINYSGVGASTNWLSSSIERTGPTTIRLFAILDNASPYTMTVTGNYIFEADIRTFLSPWQG